MRPGLFFSFFHLHDIYNFFVKIVAAGCAVLPRRDCAGTAWRRSAQFDSFVVQLNNLI
jgi:hypothetical protein